MRATVITDASFCQQQCVGGWAAWVALDGGRKVQLSGPLAKQAPKSSIEAELMALINGIWIAHNEGAISILVQSDCQGALLVIDGNSKSERLNKLWAEAKEQYRFTPYIQTRHVKGHTNNKEARFYVNRWCDTEAKEHMRKQRRHVHKRRAKPQDQPAYRGDAVG